MKDKITLTTVEITPKSNVKNIAAVKLVTTMGSLYLEGMSLQKHELSSSANLNISFLVADDLGLMHPPLSLKWCEYDERAWIEVQDWIGQFLKARLRTEDISEGFGMEFEIGSQPFTERAVDFIRAFWTRFRLSEYLLEKRLKIHQTTLVAYKTIGYMTYAHSLLLDRGVLKLPIITHLVANIG